MNDQSDQHLHQVADQLAIAIRALQQAHAALLKATNGNFAKQGTVPNITETGRLLELAKEHEHQAVPAPEFARDLLRALKNKP